MAEESDFTRGTPEQSGGRTPKKRGRKRSEPTPSQLYSEPNARRRETQRHIEEADREGLGRTQEGSEETKRIETEERAREVTGLVITTKVTEKAMSNTIKELERMYEKRGVKASDRKFARRALEVLRPGLQWKGVDRAGTHARVVDEESLSKALERAFHERHSPGDRQRGWIADEKRILRIMQKQAAAVAKDLDPEEISANLIPSPECIEYALGVVSCSEDVRDAVRNRLMPDGTHVRMSPQDRVLLVKGYRRFAGWVEKRFFAPRQSGSRKRKDDFDTRAAEELFLLGLGKEEELK